MKQEKVISISLNQLDAFIQEGLFSSVFVLVDENTEKYCLPILFQYTSKTHIEILQIASGESYKNIDTCVNLWQELTLRGADRKSLLLNLGGGVITDMGGFIASTFKRGISFINIPTTLLAMTDAAIGGKTGIDFMGLKNQIGLFANAKALVIHPDFLKTLPKRELDSGLAEVIKYGLIKDISIWDYISKLDENYASLDTIIIERSIEIKNQIVAQDPHEKGIRKVLNFGHTLGHAIESSFMESTKHGSLLHGEAVALGMILSLHLSHQVQGFSIEKCNTISKSIIKFYKKRLPEQFSPNQINTILSLLKHDKKNVQGKVNFILLKDIGEPVLDCLVDSATIQNSFDYYSKIYRLL